MSESQPSVEPEEIDVGAVPDGGLRLWIAREALRQTELRFATQNANIAAMEARATAILGWSVAAVVALSLAASRPTLLPVAVVSGTALLVSALLCIAAMWPRRWYSSGYDLDMLTEFGYKTELEMTEAIALGHASGARLNDRRLRTFKLLLRAAWIVFVAAPIAGLIVA